MTSLTPQLAARMLDLWPAYRIAQQRGKFVRPLLEIAQNEPEAKRLAVLVGIHEGALLQSVRKPALDSAR